MKHALGVAVLMAGVLGHRSPVTADPRGEVPSMAGDEAAPPEEVAAVDVLEKCAGDPPRKTDADHEFGEVWPKQWECAEVARAIVKGGTDADRERLWSVFDALPEGSPMVEDVLDAFLDRDVERALAALSPAPAPPPAESIVPGIELPAYLRDAPDDMQQAWRLYQAAEQAHRKMLERPVAGAAIAFQSNAPAFQRVVASFLRGRVSPANVVRDLSRFEWLGSCGTGSETLYAPQAKALLLAHLQLGRPDLALAAASGGFTRAQADVGGDPRLLSAAGIDWERFDLGGVLSLQLDLSVPLVRQGSDRAARDLLAVAHIFAAAPEEPARDSLESLLWPLAALVEPSDLDGDLRGSDSREVGPRAADAEAVPSDVQEGVLDLLAEQVGPDASFNEAETASYLLVKLGRPETRPAFRAMLRSPFEGVRKSGAEGLRALGETAPDPLPSRPVTFQVLLDGRPAKNSALWWMLETADGRGLSDSAQTDGAGFVHIARDNFVDPHRLVVSVRLGTPDLKAADSERFAVTLAAPDLDTVTKVSVRTGELTVVIPPALFDASLPPTLMLLAVSDDDGPGGPGDDGANGAGLDANTSLISESLPVTSAQVTFPRLQHGRYQVWLRRGGDMHVSPVVEVGADPATTTVTLDPLYSAPVDDPEERAARPTNQPL